MKKTLAAKMATIMGELSRLPKTGRNDFHKYDFLEESVLVDAVRPLLAAQGIGVSQQILEYSQDGNRSIVHLKIIYRDGDSGEEMFSTGIGEGVDKSDKGLPKATTSAFKYALKNTFLISSGDDVENDEVEAKPGRRYQGDQLDQGLKNARVRMEPKSKEGKEAADRVKLTARVFELFASTGLPKKEQDLARSNYLSKTFKARGLGELSREQLVVFGKMFASLKMTPTEADSPAPRIEWVRRWADI